MLYFNILNTINLLFSLFLEKIFVNKNQKNIFFDKSNPHQIKWVLCYHLHIYKQNNTNTANLGTYILFK